jgi:ferredoxin--NADP+ reductase
MPRRDKKNTVLFEHSITNNQEISPGVHLISFQRKFEFLPGQVVKVGVNQRHPPRIYSICSGNHEEELHILFNIKEDGFLSPKMAALIPGDKLFVSEPYGSFVGKPDTAWWIATGTGIAPFYSMFRSGLSDNKTLIHGVSHLNQFYFEDELEWAMDKNYIRCCSRENSCNTYPGRVTRYVQEINYLPDVMYFLCGKAEAVVEIRDLLIAKGIAFEKILSEIYF